MIYKLLLRKLKFEPLEPPSPQIKQQQKPGVKSGAPEG